MEYNDWLRHKDLEYENGVLHIGGMSSLDLVEAYGTPIYVINERLVRKRYKSLKSILDSAYDNNMIHFAVKANTNLSMLKILLSEGAGFDCTSAGEIHACFKAGVPADKIIYTGNMFTNEDFEYAVKNNVIVNLDSKSQLKRLATVHDKLGIEKEVISFRFNPEFGAGHHVHTITAGKEIKFGILDNQVIDAYKEAQDLGFKKFGIHIHIGSGIIDANDYDRATQRYMETIKKLADTLNIKFEFVDFGGGLGIPYKPEQEPLDLERYKELIALRFKEIVESEDLGSPILKIEPGRFLSAEPSIVLAQINTIKHNGFKWFVGLNAGFNTLIRPTMYGSYHHIVNCKERQGDKVVYDIAGPICESGDILGKEREFIKLEEGDNLAILDAGAYGFTMSSPYNSRPRCAEILVADGKHYKIREAETFDDLLKHQIIPEHLK